jgi:hypothetical protein
MYVCLVAFFGIANGSVLSRIQNGEADNIDIATVCPCGQTLSRDAEYICDATTHISAPTANCTQWRLATNLALVDGACRNCTKVAEYIYELCQVQVTPFMVAELIPATCTSATNLLGTGCINACLASSDFCSDPTSPDLTRCQGTCGDYFGCRCYQVKGSLNFQCYGSTVSGKSCYDLLEQQTPQVARTCGAESTCNPYFICPTDRCLAFDVQCPATSDCFENPGFCDPASGACSFSEKPDGSPCDDGLFYTNSEQCLAGQCVGVADVCLQHRVQCSMPHNPCVQSGSCVSKTGDCRFVKTPAGTLCDDGDDRTRGDQCDGGGVCKGTLFNPCEGVTCQIPVDEPCILAASCFNGNCVFSKEAELESCGELKVCAEGRCLPVQDTVFAKVGNGHCVDENDVDINHYFNDVNTQAECSNHCLNDPLCIGYSFIPFTGRTCFIYAPERTRTALNFWTFRGGLPGVAIQGTKSLGAIEEFCYSRATGIPEQVAVFGANEYLISPMGIVIFLLIISASWLLYIKVYYTQVNSFVMRFATKIKSCFSKKSE